MSERYGEDIEYKIDLLDFSDKSNIQKFSCGNEILDCYIKSEIFGKSELLLNDGLHFKVVDVSTNDIIGFFSLATSGIIHQQDNYIHILPAIKIDVFAIDKKFQKLHFNEDSKNSKTSDEHYYFADQILMEVIKHCREIDENYALVNYIILYSAKSAVHFYKRNLFKEFEPFMKKEQMQEINANIPMCMEL